MKRFCAGLALCLLSLHTVAQSKDENTLLWKISGKGMEKPSWLFGTIHILCEEDAVLSANLLKAIEASDDVYFEVDMDNMIEMFGAVRKMRMLGDTTLKDLLSAQDYQKVKRYFESKSTMLPFSVLETYKPILAASTLQEDNLPCEETSMMEQVIMREAKEKGKKIKGLESMSYQAGVLDSIPYKLQAQQLVSYIDKANKGENQDEELEEMFKAYKAQDLKKLEEMLIETDAGMAGFTEILLYHRNENWLQKLEEKLGGRSLVIAVGAGHLPGKRGLIQLLRKAGYTVTPVDNKVKKEREI